MTKKRLIISLSFLCAIVQGVLAWDGSGTKYDPYQLASNADWRQLAADVAAGNSYRDKYFKMVRGIDVTSSVGTETHPFSGHFDGQGFRLQYNTTSGYITGQTGYCAPFVLLSGATILNLHVAGTVRSAGEYTAGIASLVGGDQPTSFENCSVTSYFELQRDAFGGFVGKVLDSCTAPLKFKDCQFFGQISISKSRNAGFVGYSPITVNFDHCIVDAASDIDTRQDRDNATFVRTAEGVACTFERSSFTRPFGTPQGTCVFREVLVPDGLTCTILGASTEHFGGREYWSAGAYVNIDGPAVAGFNHWDTGTGGCFVSNPMEQNGSHQLFDIRTVPSLTVSTGAIGARKERTMDGTVYRYLGAEDYHLYLPDEVCTRKGYTFDGDGWLVKWVGSTKVFITAVTGYEGGKIPGDGAQIHNDLSGYFHDYTFMACIAPQAFKGCGELRTLYFKDTDASAYDAQGRLDFIIGDKAFANCPNLTEIKMMQYTTKGSNHWEALTPDQVSSLADNVFEGSAQARFSTDASQYQAFMGSETWKNMRRRIVVYNHTNVDMNVNGARYTYVRNTKGDPLKNDTEGNQEMMQMLRLWNADYRQFSANSLLTNSSENVWYSTVVGANDSYLKSNEGVMRIYNDPGSYYNYKTIAIGRNAFKGSKELRAIEFWQTNGRSENSETDLKLVIQNGAFANCDNLKELRMYYYVQDGDDNWQVLGPKDVIPGDNIFGVHREGEPFDINTSSFIPDDFRILVAPQLYNDFISDPNWSKYSLYITPREYAPTKWDPIETDGLVYDYASKTVNTASTNQVVTQNLSWWNVPIKIYEIVMFVKSISDIVQSARTFELQYLRRYNRAYTEYSNKLAFQAEVLKANEAANKPMRDLADALMRGEKGPVDEVLKMHCTDVTMRNTALSKELAKKGLYVYQEDGVPLWASNARDLLMESEELRKELGRDFSNFYANLLDGYANQSGVKIELGRLLTKLNQVRSTLPTRLLELGGNATAAISPTVVNGLISQALPAYLATDGHLDNEAFQRGLAENIKANIHNVSYENTMVYTPDKKLIYHVYVSKPYKKQKKYTIYHDIGNVWNYRTVAISRDAFRGNKELEEIDFAEIPYKDRTTYVPMQITIPDSAFAGCTSLKSFSLIYRTQLRGATDDKNDERALGPENFILGGEHIFDGCDPQKLKIIIPEERKEDFLNDEIWSNYKDYFSYQQVSEYGKYSEYGVRYTYYYDKNTSLRQSRVSGHTIDHLTAISADNEFLDGHQGSMGLFNDIGTFNNYKLDLVKRKAFAGNQSLRTVAFFDLNGGDAYTTLDLDLGDSCFVNCRNLKNIDMIYCVTDGKDHLEPLKPSQVRAGVGMFDGAPDCIIKMLPQQLAWFQADSAWARYKDRFLPCIIQPADEGVVKALKDYRYYTPCCDPYYWDGTVDLARIGGAGFSALDGKFAEQKDNIRSFAEFKQFECVRLDFVGRQWFSGLTKLTDILLPSTVKTIMDGAFSKCSSLAEIEIPAAVTSIGDGAFADCSALTTIVVHGKKPATLGSGVFTKNTGLRIYVPSGSLGDYKTAWAEYKDYIVSDAEYKISKVVTVTKPDELADKLGLYVEMSYSGLNFGDEPRYVHGQYAKFDSLTISGPLGNVDLAVIRYLAGCDAYTGGGKATDGRLRYLNLYNATIKKTDDGYNFYNDPYSMNGTRYSIKNDNELPDNAFNGCRALETVILPKSLTRMRALIFDGCSGLKRLAVTSALEDYDSWAYTKGILGYPLAELVFSAESPATSSRRDPWGQPISAVYTKNALLGEYMGQTYLTVQARNIVAPFEDDAVTEALFEKGHYFPSEFLSLENIDGIFANNKKITRFDDFALFSNVRELGDDAFYDCANMKVIMLPDSLERISRKAFANCSRLDTIYISTPKVPELAEDAFGGLPAGFHILVPKDLCKLYREKWAQYADHINVDGGFYRSNPIKTVTVTRPNTLGKALGLETTIASTWTIWEKFLQGVKGDYSDITRLKVVGPISSTDFDLLRHLAGYCPWTHKRNYMGHLEYLDLYDADIVEESGYVHLAEGTVTGGGMTIGTNDNELPSQAFLKAYSLRTLILPRTCRKVRTRAMQECENLETLVIGDDMETFNWDALDDGASLTRMYILAKKKPEISAEWAVWRWLCNNYNPTFDAFYVRPSLYNDYVSDADYTGSSWQRTNNVSKGLFDDDDSFAAFAAHAAATADDLAGVTTVEGWFDKHQDLKDLTMLRYTAVSELTKATLAPLTKLERIALSPSLSRMEDGLVGNAKGLRYVDMLLCDSADIVASMHNDGFKRLGIDTQQTLVYVPATYGESDGTNIVAASGGFADGSGSSDSAAPDFSAKAFRMIDTLDYQVPYAFQTGKVENTRKMPASSVPYTVCLPYKMDVPAYSRAYALSDRTGNTLVFKEVTGELEAMKPYLLKVVGNKRLRKTSATLDSEKEQTIPASGGSTYGGQDDAPGYSLRGTFDAIDNKTAADMGAYILQTDGNWHPVVSGSPAGNAAGIPPFRAFLLPSAHNAGARIGMFLEDDTDIEAIETIDNDDTRHYYDLQGRELAGKPANGIYIYNGKKLMSK